MSLVGTDLNLLVALRALLEEANVTRAGQRLNMGQSSMSTALSRLRLQFDDELLVRIGRDYELTPLARLLLPQLQLTLPLVERSLESDDGFNQALSRRTFTVMMSDFAALELRAEFAEVLGAQNLIHIEQHTLPDTPMSSERDMVAHDFAVAVPGIGIEGESIELFTDHYVCIVDPRNTAVVDCEISWERFIQLEHAVCHFGTSHLTPADRRLRELGVGREPRVKASSFLALPSIVSGTEMVAVVPRMLASRLGEATGVISVRPPFGLVEIIETLWWHPSHHADPGHQWFRETLANRFTASDEYRRIA